MISDSSVSIPNHPIVLTKIDIAYKKILSNELKWQCIGSSAAMNCSWWHSEFPRTLYLRHTTRRKWLHIAYSNLYISLSYYRGRLSEIPLALPRQVGPAVLGNCSVRECENRLFRDQTNTNLKRRCLGCPHYRACIIPAASALVKSPPASFGAMSYAFSRTPALQPRKGHWRQCDINCLVK